LPADPARAPNREAAIGQAPGDLAILQAFVNTLDIEQGTDALASPADLDHWLRAAGLLAGAAAAPARTRDLAAAIELREALRGVLRSHVSHQASADGADTQNFAGGRYVTGADPATRLADIAGNVQASLQADGRGNVFVVPAGSGPAAGLAKLLLIAATATTVGTWTRLKVCSADDCQWAFYDRSPRRNGCWCTMQICGSRAKSRAYRARVGRAS
jgi:predicted RNA-binding Zn ribbon-like protein